LQSSFQNKVAGKDIKLVMETIFSSH